MSILLPHSDDEIFILPFIAKKIAEGFKVYVFFLTTDLNAVREGESDKMLSSFARLEVIHFGILNTIHDGKLFEKKLFVIDELGKNAHIVTSDFLVCPTYEGGHVDHDELFKITYSLSQLLKKPLICFSTYNAYKTPFVRVATIVPGPVRGEIKTVAFTFNEGRSYLRKCFFYRSQFIILAMLFPGLLRVFLIKRQIDLLEVSSFDPNSKNLGRLFYENPWKEKIKAMLRVK